MKVLRYFLFQSSLITIALIKVASAHGDIPHGAETAEPSFPIFVALGAAIISGVFPIVFGFLVPHWLRQADTLPFSLKENLEPLMRGMSFGFLLFLFYDFGVLSSFAGLNSSDLVLRIILPLILFSGLVLIDLRALGREGENIWLFIWLFGIAFHSTAEGIIMGANFLLPEPDVLRFFPAISFIFHKFAEGFIAGVLLTDKKTTEKGIIIKGTIASSFILIGVLGGYYNIQTFGRYISYLYTITLVTITSTLFYLGQRRNSSEDKTFFRGSILGILLLYLFTILHEV
ncbi:MAG: hypothetical protein D6732_28080 [Methanobacteriota archaeon]|nr:MAG: hypothetical protein D6732_28080 [Euryarchaeota archaeon]